MNPPRASRPIGLILAAILLGLITLSIFASGAFTLLAAVVMPQGTLAANPSATSAASSPHILRMLLAAVAVVELLVAGWGIFTVVGIIRLRNWARYSILVIGGLLAFAGITSAAGLALLPSIMDQVNRTQPSQQAALPPHLMQGMLIGLGLFYTVVAGIGVWWLVYFNLRTVKSYFLPQYVQPANPFYSSAASLATPGGLAEALPAPPPVPSAGRFAHVPTSIKVIAIFFFFSAAVTCIFALLPFPGSIASFYVYGVPGHLLNLAYAAFMFLLGFGLLKLDHRARLGVYALVALAVVNVIPLFTAGGRGRFQAYNQHIQQQMQLTPTAPIVDPSRPVFVIVGLVFGLVFYGVILFLVERHRTLFEQSTLR